MRPADSCQQTALGTFAPLWNRSLIDLLVAPFLLRDHDAYAPLGYPPAFGRPLLGLFPDDSARAAWDPHRLWDWGLHGANHTHNATCFIPLTNSSWTVADLGIVPATVVFSYEPIDLHWLEGCDACPKRRQLGMRAPGEAAAAAGASDSGATGTGGRVLTGDTSADTPPPLLVTGIAVPACQRPDPANWAMVLRDPASGSAEHVADIQTLNGLLMLIDQPIFPPNVLLTLWEAGLRPFLSSPPASLLTPPRPGCPHTAVRPGSLARLLLALQLADPAQGFLP